MHAPGPHHRACRQGVVGAASVHHLCKSIVMVNTRAPPHSEPHESKWTLPGCPAGIRGSPEDCPWQPHLVGAEQLDHAPHCPVTPPLCPAVVDCFDPNNSKYYLIVVQVRHARCPAFKSCSLRHELQGGMLMRWLHCSCTSSSGSQLPGLQRVSAGALRAVRLEVWPPDTLRSPSDRPHSHLVLGSTPPA